MRDSARGLLYSLFQDITKDKNNIALISEINEASKKDLTLKMILITKEEATQQESELTKTECTVSCEKI